MTITLGFCFFFASEHGCQIVCRVLDAHRSIVASLRKKGHDAKDIDNEDAQQAARLWTYFDKDPSDQGLARRTLQAEIKAKIKEYRA